eukprot:gene2604-2990_t
MHVLDAISYVGSEALQFREGFQKFVSVLCTGARSRVLPNLINTRHVDIEVFKFFRQPQFEERLFISIEMLDKAAEYGSLELVEYLHTNRTEGCTTNAMDNAGSPAVLEYLHTNRSEGCTVRAMENAAEKGDLSMVIYLDTNRTEGCTEWAMDNAATNGHLSVVKWLHFNRTEGCTTNAMDDASLGGHLDILTWLHFNRTEGCTERAMASAAVNGHLSIVEYLSKHRTEGCTEDAMDWASSDGHLDIVTWLHFNRSEGCTESAIDDAAMNGDMDMVSFLHHNRSEGCSTRAMDSALIRKQYEVLRFLAENRSEGFYEEFIIHAAQYNNHYARSLLQPEHLGKWHEALLEAIEYGHIEWVQYTIDLGTKEIIDISTEEYIKALEHACTFGQLEILKLLISHWTALFPIEDSYPISFLLLNACQYDHMPIARYLIDNNNRLDIGSQQRIVEAAIMESRLSIVKFLVDQHGYALPNLETQFLSITISMANYLIQHGVSKHLFLFPAIQHGFLSFFQELFPSLFDTSDDSNINPTELLIYSLRFNRLDIIEYICQHPLAIELMNDDDYEKLLCYSGESIACINHIIQNYRHTVQPGSRRKFLNLENDHTYIYLYSKGYKFPYETKSFLGDMFPKYPYLANTEFRQQHLQSSLLARFINHNVESLDGAKIDMKLLLNSRVPLISIIPHMSDIGLFQPTFIDDIFHSGKGDLSVIQYLDQHRAEGFTTNAMDRAAAQGDLSVVKYLHFHRTEGCTTDALDEAASRGDIPMFEFLQSHRTEGYYQALKNAIMENQLSMVKLIHRHYPNVFSDPNNYIGNSYYPNPICHTAQKGFMPMLRYLQANIAPERFKCALDGAKSLVVFKFLHDCGIEGWTTKAMDTAADAGNLPLVKFLHDNRSEGCTTKAIDLAANAGNLPLVKFLHENRSEGCTTDAMDNAASKGYLSIVRFLHTNRTEGCTTKAMDRAADNSYLSVVRFLNFNRTEGCSNRLISNISRNNLVYEFLKEHRTPHSDSEDHWDTDDDNEYY